MFLKKNNKNYEGWIPYLHILFPIKGNIHKIKESNHEFPSVKEAFSFIFNTTKGDILYIPKGYRFLISPGIILNAYSNDILGILCYKEEKPKFFVNINYFENAPSTHLVYIKRELKKFGLNPNKDISYETVDKLNSWSNILIITLDSYKPEVQEEISKDFIEELKKEYNNEE